MMTPKAPLIAALSLGLSLTAGAAAAQDSYRIRAGDILRIEVIEDPTLNRSVLVSPDGRISMPLAGAIRASGQPIEAVQAALAAQLAPNFAAPPTVFVSVERLAEVRPSAPAVAAAPPVVTVFVMGEAGNPGRIEVEPGTTLLQLFAQMGGFSRFAATSRIQLRRTIDGTETIYQIDYDAIEAGTSPNGAVTLAEGDVIVVPQRRLFE
jgi:polysaccharide export outer membrane protein